MNPNYSWKNGEKFVDVNKTAARVIEMAFLCGNREYCLGTLPMLRRECGKVQGLTPEQSIAVEKALRAIISAGVKAQTIVKLGRNSWDFTAWVAKADLDRSAEMIEYYENEPDKEQLLEMFNRDHEEASLRLVAAIARYSVDYVMPEPETV